MSLPWLLLYLALALPLPPLIHGLEANIAELADGSGWLAIWHADDEGA